MVNKDMNHQKEIKEFRSLHAIFIVLLREILQQFLVRYLQAFVPYILIFFFKLTESTC